MAFGLLLPISVPTFAALSATPQRLPLSVLRMMHALPVSPVPESSVPLFCPKK